MVFGSRLHITLTHCLAITAGTAVVKRSALICQGGSFQSASNLTVRSLYLTSVWRAEGANMNNHWCTMLVIQVNIKQGDDAACRTSFKYSLCAGAAGRWSGMASVPLLHTGVGTLHQQALSQRPVWVSNPAVTYIQQEQKHWHYCSHISQQAAINCGDENSAHLFSSRPLPEQSHAIGWRAAVASRYDL